MTEITEENKQEQREEFVAQPLTQDQVDYAYEIIDEIHPIESYPLYDAFPYLKWICSSCCHGIPYLKPYDPNGPANGAGVEEEDAALLNTRQTSTAVKTFTVNGKEYKKRSKKPKKSHMGENAKVAEPIA